MKLRIKIDGMGCEHCVKGVTAALEGVGATVSECGVGIALVEFGGEMKELSLAVSDAGYDVVSIAEA